MRQPGDASLADSDAPVGTTALRVRRHGAGVAFLVVALASPACRQDTDLYPASASEPSAAGLDRYVRRAYLDLTGVVPDEAVLRAEQATLADGGAAVEARLAFATRLVASEAFAQKLADDLRSAAFDGVPAERVFALFCRASANSDGACERCPFDTPDPCACDCNGPRLLAAERAQIEAMATTLAAGAPVGDVERDLAKSSIYQMHGGTPETIAESLFEDFFARPPEADEIRNVRSCVLGTGFGGMGCTIFRENARSYADMVEKAFGSEVYREAAVRRVFERLLGRSPSPAEYRAFTHAAPGESFDVRDLIVRVVASAEYFDLG